MEFTPGDPEEVFQIICENFDSPPPVQPFSKQLVLGVCEKIEDLDRLIIKSSKNWRLERMPRVDRNILRVGVYEILFREDIPPRVSIDEAVELAKKYGTEESGAFINGILDDIYNSLVAGGEIEEHGEPSS